MQNGILREFENNPDVVAVMFDEGGGHGETLSWVQTVWSRYFLRGKIIWDPAGTTGRPVYDQPSTGLPFGRSFLIDQQGKVVLAEFGYNPATAIRTIYELLNRPSSGQSRTLADGTEVRLEGKPVTASSSQIGGAFYIEDLERAGGIRVKWPVSPAIPYGASATVVGKLSTLSSGEREVIPSFVTLGEPAIVDPLGLTNLALGGSREAAGLSSVGLLVTVCGRVTELGSGCFWIDDGSGTSSDTGHYGVRIVTGSLPLPPELQTGACVRATGISGSIDLGGGSVAKCVLARFASDVVVLQGGN